MFSLEHKKVISSCELFEGMNEDALSHAFSFFSAYVKKYVKGECVCPCGSSMPSFGLVLRGSVQVFSDDINGNRIIMASASAGNTFGESLCFLQVKEIPVCIYAFEDTEILWLKGAPLHSLGAVTDSRDRVLCERFVSMLAKRTLSMNDRIQILSKLTLREKLITYFSYCARESGGRTFHIPHNRESLAIYLGVNRSALSRELSRMKKEGIIEYYRNSFKIL